MGETSKLIGLLGGSFNPIHNAHLMICEHLLAAEQADEVWLIPTAHHVFAKTLAPFEKRVAMCELAIESFGDRAKINTIEKDLPAPNYTVNTLEELHNRHPEYKFLFAVGSDILNEQHKWHRFERVRELARLVVLGREGQTKSGGSFSVVLPDISSTEIRRLVAAGKPISHLVPQAVEKYVLEEGLYKDG